MSITRAAIVFVAAGLPCSAVAQVLWDNGPLLTLPTGACIPVGGSSSQLQSAGGFPNGIISVGFMLSGATNNRIADDFVVADPNGWTLSTIDVTAFQTFAPTTANPIAAINVRIWNGQPGTVGAQVVFGDTTTNRLTGAVFTNSYRLGSACGVTRAMFRCTVAVNTSLAPGTYWLDWQAVGSPAYPSGPWAPLVTIAGLRGKPGANGIQSLDGGVVWDAIVDSGPAPEFSSPPVAQDFPFVISGTVNPPSCYPNCDGSSGTPVLTANDFVCFINAFAAGQSSANCDQSTSIPVLTGNDFVCFVNAYAVGCS